MLKWFIGSTIILFYTHHRVINQLTDRLNALQLNVTRFNETSEFSLMSLSAKTNYLTERVDAQMSGTIVYLKERVDNIDLRMSALENTIK